MPRWDENKGLSLADLRDTKHAVIVASMAGKPLNFYLTLTPLRLIAAADKPALFQRERGRIGQRLGRRPFCVPFVGLFIRELKADDPNDAGEHCHGLLHLPDAVDAELILRAVSRDIDAQLQENKGYAGIMTRQAYMQKEREGQAEGWLKKNRVPRYTWEDPAPLIGPRWSLTRGLQALVDADAARPRFYPVRVPSEASAPPVLRLVVNALVPGPTQLTLFPEKERPVSRLAQFAHGVMPPVVAREVEWRQQGRRLTQAALAAHIGLSRPQLANALKGRFGLSEWAAARLREFLLRDVTPSLARAA